MNIPNELSEFINYGPYQLCLKQSYNCYISKMNWPVESENGKHHVIVVATKKMMELTDYEGNLRSPYIKEFFKRFGYNYYWCFNWTDLYFLKKNLIE